MTNIIGQLLIVLAVNVTTNCAEFVKHDTETVAMSNGVEWTGTGTVYVATAQTTNAPVSKQIETRVGAYTPKGSTNYMFSVWTTEVMTNGLPDCWFRSSIHWDSVGLGVNK